MILANLKLILITIRPEMPSEMLSKTLEITIFKSQWGMTYVQPCVSIFLQSNVHVVG